MLAKITYLNDDDDPFYYVNCPSDCRTDTDRSAYASAVELQDIILMGRILVQPMGPRNSAEKVMEWVEKVLSTSFLLDTERKALRQAAFPMVANGMWRGDISDKWRAMGFGSDRLRDLY